MTLAAVPLLVALAAGPAQSAKAFPFPMEAKTLPNGLRVVLVPYEAPGLAAYYTLVRVGSRNEAEKGRSGYGHFFEHMMFRGTKAHPAHEYNATMTRLGLNTNAFTDFDHTVYHLYGPAKALPTIIEYEADRFQKLEYTEAEFKTEAGAILGEYAKSASNPEQKLEEKMLETAFARHTYRHTVIGYLQDIEAMPAGFDYSREFFRRYYTPDNTTIIVAGDFDRAQTFALIEKFYGPWKGRLDPVGIPVEPRQTQSKRANVPWRTPTLPRLWIAWHAPSAQDLKAAAVQNLLNAYLFGPTSPLYQNLVLGKQTVDSIVPTYEDERDPALFGGLFRVKQEKELRAVERAVLRQISDLARGKVDAARLSAVQSNLRYGNILALDKPDAVAVRLATTASKTGDLQFVNKLYAQIDALRPADLSEFAKRYLLDKNRTTVTLTTTETATPRARAARRAAKGGAR